MKALQRLILYCNRIPSLEGVTELYELPALRELDLRLNPLTKRHPHYRPHLVHTLPNLRKLGENHVAQIVLTSGQFAVQLSVLLFSLDGCSVRDVERKAAIMQFSSECLDQQKSSYVAQAAEQRYTDA